MRIFLLLLLLGLTTSASCADFNYDAYKPSQLATIVGTLAPRGGSSFVDGHPRYHTQATFTGRIRATDAGLRTYIRTWVKSMGHPPAYAGLFRRQVEIEQDHVAYWMPIQDELVDPLEKEVAAGGRVELYLLLMGTYKHLPVFVVNEFDAAAAASAASPDK